MSEKYSNDVNLIHDFHFAFLIGNSYWWMAIGTKEWRQRNFVQIS